MRRLLCLGLLWLWTGPPHAVADIIVGGDRDFPPFEYLNEQGQPEGFNIDLIQAIAELSQQPMRTQLGRWDDIFQAFERGEIQIAGVYYNQERAQKFLLSDPITITSYSFFKHKDAPSIQSPTDLVDSRILVQTNTYGEKHIQALLPNAELVRVDSELEALKQLNTGSYQYAYVTFQTARYMINRADLRNVLPTGAETSAHHYVFAVHKDYPELLQVINQGMSSLKGSGEFERLYNKWMGTTRAEVLEKFRWGLIALGLGSFLLLSWVGMLRIQVKRAKIKLAAELNARGRAEQDIMQLAKTQQWVSETSQLGIWTYNFEERTFAPNTWFCTLFDLTGPMLKVSLGSVMQPLAAEDRNALDHFIQLLKQQPQQPQQVQLHLGEHVLRLQGQYAQENGGKARGIVQDITQEYSISHELNRQQRSMEALVANIPGAVYRASLEPELPLIFLSEGIEHILGQGAQPESVPSLKSLVLTEDWSTFNQSLLRALPEQAHFSLSHRVLDNQGQVRWVLNQGQPCEDDEGNIWIEGVCFDETEQILHAQHLDYLAHRDVLTGLGNRYSFHEYTQTALQLSKNQDRMLALILLDLDNFKTINDTQGHDFGDRVLQELALRLQQGLTNQESLFRLGGDEFVVVLANLHSIEELTQELRHLRQNLHAPLQVDGQTLVLTASLGISLFPDDGDSVKSLMGNADTALYKAKAQGKNTFAFYTASMGENARRRYWLEQELRQALQDKKIQVFYQPQFRVSDQHTVLVGAEALARWQHPQQGAITPAEFIPVAELAGLIGPLGQQVLEQSCQQLALWREQGFQDFVMSVNASAQELLDPGYLLRLQRLLAEYRLPASSLMLEITESTFIEDTPQLREQLDALNLLGIQLSIDDFGVGYSSLSYLQRFRVNTLKIDRSFIQNIEQPETQTLVGAIMALGRGLNIEVIAEGCEQQQQLQLLCQQGPVLVQGYLLGRPVPAQQFAQQHLLSAKAQPKRNGVKKP